MGGELRKGPIPEDDLPQKESTPRGEKKKREAVEKRRLMRTFTGGKTNFATLHTSEGEKIDTEEDQGPFSSP